MRFGFSFKSAGLLVLLIAVLGAIPLSAQQPSIDPIPNITVPAGKSVVIPVFGTTANKRKLTYTATSSLPSAVTARVHAENPWLKISVQDFGDMTFMLFRDRTPKTAGFIRDLADTDFYNGLTFHRVISGFVVQTGDPAGDGSGGPDFSFEDEFDPTLIFSGTGQLAMANSGKDSNGSQLFVTLGPQRDLDFNHTIFGQLVRGFDVLGRIASVPTQNSAPITPVVISRAGTVTNYADTVLTILGSHETNAVATVTLTATDEFGGKTTRTFEVRVTADTVDDPVILGAIENQITPANAPLAIPLRATDLEDHPVSYAAQLIGDSTNHASISITGGSTLTVTPNQGYTGTLLCIVGARQENATRRGSTSNPFDIQVVVVGVGAEPIIATPATLLSLPNYPLVNGIVGRFTVPDPSAEPEDFTGSIIWGDFRATDAEIVQDPDGSFVILGHHRYLVPGEYRITVSVSSEKGATANIESRAVVLPSLDIRREGNEQVVRWPFRAGSFQLQSATVLEPRLWSDTTVLPEPGSFEIEHRSSGPQNHFYRLQWPID